ncbi:MAG: hypothetical protein ACTTG8_00245 [Catonella sp.]|uniref:hypothetical protein n=1 Tax=Catonella sp. TaxID=2382125 RepID=UPI003F9F0929
MGIILKSVILVVSFFMAGLGMRGQLMADERLEEIVPNLNVIRSLEEKDQINMYKTAVNEKGYQNITLNFDETKKDQVKNGWTIKVYDENKKEIYKVEGVKTQFTTGNFSFVKDKIVYISIESATSGFLFMPKGVEYNLNFHTYSADDYESEPNNKYLNANEIETGSYIKGNLINSLDEDYYVCKVDANGYTELSFEILDFEPDKIGNGWDIEIYDKNKSLLYKEENIKKDTGFPKLPLVKGQEIYIRIKAKGSLLYVAPEEVEYKLQASLTKTDKWELEDNGSFSKANKLKGTLSGNILNDGDIDYFEFKAGKSGKYKISLNTGDNVDGEYRVEIFVKNKGKAVLKEQTKGDKSFTIKAKKGQKVWIKLSGVYGKSPIGNEYSLKYKAVKNIKKKIAKK